MAALLAGCATGADRPAPRIDRLPVQDAAVAPAAVSTPAPALSPDELMALHRAGATADAIIQRWREDGARLRLSAADLLALHQRGMPLPVLDKLLEARETALRTDADSRLAAAQARFDVELAAERARPRSCPSPAWSPYSLHPYGGWACPGVRRGGMFYGW